VVIFQFVKMVGEKGLCITVHRQVVLLKSKFPPSDIDTQLQHEYGYVCTGASNIRWVEQLKDGNIDITHQRQWGVPRAASTEYNKR
jgi:hypothetical protein